MTTELVSTEGAIEEALGYPDYKRFSRVGESARIIQTKLVDSPKIFCPVIVDVMVVLDKARNGIPLMETEIPEVMRGYLGVSEDLIIDVIPMQESQVYVVLRDVPVPSISVGHKVTSRVHNVTLIVSNIIDTNEDMDVSRRKEICSSLAADTSADAIQVCVPQNWIIPDSEFKPKSATLPIYPNSLWLLFFRNSWGSVSGSTICFRSNFANQFGMISLLVRFREHKALRQALLFLHKRYLIHPREGMGMRMTFAHPINFQKVVDEAEGKISLSKPHISLDQHLARPASLTSHALTQSLLTNKNKDENSLSGSSAVLPEGIADAFNSMLEKIEKLETENQRLVDLLVTKEDNDDDEKGDTDNDEDDNIRERSPRSLGIEMIPSQGLPPWKRNRGAV